MARPATVAALLSALVLAALVIAAVEPWQPPPPDDVGPHSYSGRVLGYRGLYETLDALGFSVSRHTGSPGRLFEGDRRVLLLDPNLFRIEREKGYLAQMERWIASGGEAVVLTRDLRLFDGPEVFPAEAEDPAPEDGSEDPFQTEEDRLREVLGPDEFRHRLGVGDIRIEPEEDDSFGPEAESLPEALRRGLRVPARPDGRYEPVFSGTFRPWGRDIRTLALPTEDYTWFAGPGVDRAVGRVDIESMDGELRPVVLEYVRGAGRVILVSEPSLLNNRGLREADNAVMAVRLAAGDGGRPLVIDEYYHGALEGLNPFALLRVHPYGAVAASLLAATLLWAWSSGVRFGAVVPHRVEPRRSILEYVDAMARLFRRARKGRFALETNRDGLLDEIRSELFLGPGVSPDAVVRRLALSDRARAERLESALKEVGAALMSPDEIPAAELLRLQERLEACRTSKGFNPTPRTPARSTASPASTVAPLKR